MFLKIDEERFSMKNLRSFLIYCYIVPKQIADSNNPCISFGKIYQDYWSLNPKLSGRDKSNRLEVFRRKGVLKNFEKSTGCTCVGFSFLLKFWARRLQLLK